MAKEQAPGNNDRNSEKFESDTQKVVHKHLEDPNHTISEEEIRNERVGMTPPNAGKDPDELNKEIEDSVEKISEEEEKRNDKDGEKPNDEPITPWDVTT